MNGFTSSQIKSDMNLCERIGLGLSEAEMAERRVPSLSSMEKLKKEFRLMPPQSTRRLSDESMEALKGFLNTSNVKTYNSLMKVLRDIPDSRYYSVVKHFNRDFNKETSKKMLALKKIIDRTR
jgi:hypothetical protein